MTEANLAVLIDFENIAAGTEKEGLGRFDVDALMKRLKDKGRILVSRSYADWGRFARFKQGLLKANVNMYELTSHGAQDKNRADIAMVVDCLELAFTRDYIDTFVVVSGDSDFTPLVLKMRELNKRVIGCGTRSSTSRLLVQACDEFIFYDSIARGRRRPSPDKPKRSGNQGITKEEAFELLADACAGIQRENPDPALASVVKTALRRKQPDFSESELGFASFARFLEAAQRQGHVQISRDTKSGGYRVDSVERPEDESRGREAQGSQERDTGPWTDPHLPKGAEPIVDLLGIDGINPLAFQTRMGILETFVQVVRDRKSRKRRINVQYAQEDVRRRMKKSHPDVPARAIRSVFTAIMRANVLMHKDGNPIRTGSAPFTTDKNADQLNQAMLNVYLSALLDRGADTSNMPLIAQLMFGNEERLREIEETIAWMEATDGSIDSIPLEGDTEGDLDSLLSFDDDDDGPAEDASDDEAPAAAKAEKSAKAEKGAKAEKAEKPPKAAKAAKGAKAEKASDLDALLDPDATADDGDDDDSDDDDSDDDADDTSDAPQPEDVANAEPEGEAKRKPRRKRVRKKAAADEGSED